MQSTSSSHLFSYKQPWRGNPNKSFSDEDTEISTCRMCGDPTSQQQKKRLKNSLLTEYIVYVLIHNTSFNGSHYSVCG